MNCETTTEMNELPPILIIDDDSGDRVLCQRVLKRMLGDRLTTLESDCGEGGLESIEKYNPGCVLLDYSLPGINGLDVLKRIRAKHRYLPVIVITGRGDVPLAVQALKAGADDFIEKPFEDETLLKVVQSALQGYRTRANKDKENADFVGRMELLSRRELQVLHGVVAGKPNKMIARELGISPRTVEVFRANMMTKMQAKTVSEIVHIALACGISTPCRQQPVRMPAQ